MENNGCFGRDRVYPVLSAWFLCISSSGVAKLSHSIKPWSRLPKGTPHQKKPSKNVSNSRMRGNVTLEARVDKIKEDLCSLPELIHKHFKTWSNGAHDFQLKYMNTLALGTDVVLHAATGSGKSMWPPSRMSLPYRQQQSTVWGVDAHVRS
ncbi:hypothetical protein SERLA73DRAFT_149165 [Serpula lacrymans var. lacrymans S7.3]|uniref:Uncharacterized protein n=1 Tax=Serpula lacrymans var. lacrymans (strain S7.3) TaxID=936435 RepID=F8PFY3_SERL3|nr:hypothetical protein SERLA73DRAFT_149165 [Serpula lacrymans var. lacrymans S7.3]